MSVSTDLMCTKRSRLPSYDFCWFKLKAKHFLIIRYTCQTPCTPNSFVKTSKVFRANCLFLKIIHTGIYHWILVNFDTLFSLPLCSPLLAILKMAGRAIFLSSPRVKSLRKVRMTDAFGFSSLLWLLGVVVGGGLLVVVALPLNWWIPMLQCNPIQLNEFVACWLFPVLTPGIVGRAFCSAGNDTIIEVRTQLSFISEWSIFVAAEIYVSNWKWPNLEEIELD